MDHIEPYGSWLSNIVVYIPNMFKRLEGLGRESPCQRFDERCWCWHTFFGVTAKLGH